ncbi:hypothetical protein PoB_003646600 [Plakobranchus ocellatus]|uniref:Uncharacterized protein n=1 Tax=Plakobranchus ocellatus TaxID=259542 RepID=A0AAV4ATT0_9GAST|nr:hypothetical protein PoB_003646600 [Plakobranchus ocellatus]
MASGSTKPSKQMRGKVDSFAAALTKKGIKLLAVDFDKTLIDIHSRGIWDEGVDKLAAHVRPCMRDLLEAAVRKGVFVAIVTFHRQGWLIKEVLHKTLPKKTAKQIYVQANTAEFLQRQRAAAKSALSSDAAGRGSEASAPPAASAAPIWSMCADLNGKEAHISSVVNEINNDHKVEVKKDEILLMDDDIDNVRTAITYGHLAFQVQQNVDYDSFESFQTMLLL